MLGFFIALLQLGQAPPESGAYMLQGGTVHTISGPVIEDGSVLVRDGKIVGVGHRLQAPEGVTVIDVHGQQVYPGMIDSASLNADPASEHLKAARINGVTTMLRLPEGDPVGVATDGPVPVIHVRFPAIATRRIPPHESADDDDEPTTAVAAEVVSYAAAKKQHDAQLKKLNRFFDEARRRPAGPMGAVLAGTAPLFVTAVREREIREAVAFAVKQKIRLILTDAYECYKVIPLLKAHDVAVILGPPLTLPLDEDDPYDRSYTTAAELAKAGVRFSIGTFSQRLSRNLPYQAAAAVAFGLPHDEGYRAVSLGAAEILGLGKRFGSIDEGKAANLIVSDGDPLEATTHVTRVFIEGKPVDMDTRQKRLAEQYRR